MSSITSILANAANSSSALGVTAKSNTTLDMQTFLRLLTVQMSHQDPLNPVSDSQFAAQLAQMGTVQGMDNLQRSGQVQEASALMGKNVVAGNPNITSTNSSSTIEGKVIGMVNKSGTFLLALQDAKGGITNISTNSIQSVTN